MFDDIQDPFERLCILEEIVVEQGRIIEDMAELENDRSRAFQQVTRNILQLGRAINSVLADIEQLRQQIEDSQQP